MLGFWSTVFMSISWFSSGSSSANTDFLQYSDILPLFHCQATAQAALKRKDDQGPVMIMC